MPTELHQEMTNPGEPSTDPPIPGLGLEQTEASPPSPAATSPKPEEIPSIVPPTATAEVRKRWGRVNDLLIEALALPESQRVDFLEKSCADTRIRGEVESLLGVDPRPVDELEQGELALFGPGRLGLAAPERIGPYRLVEKIGSGGMGTVYLAQRDDDLERQVAIKMLGAGLYDETAIRRFHNERQILAQLDHPHIAKLYDSGATEDGRPYFVMEHIRDGLAIDRFCDRHRLSIRQRLELFSKVCSAVQFAHRSLVVHRDLKPSNILVNGSGEPKLLDFGIAKLLTLDAGATLTEAGARPMTPGYASPEHVRGEPITTVSDVYSLGVLLYELLTGQRPYRIHSRIETEIRRVVCEQQPPRPSTVVSRPYEKVLADGTTTEVPPETFGERRGETPRRLRRQLTGDLDTIVLMALRKEPDRRYASAADLARDIDGYLRGLPVSARPDTFAYRTAKLIRRRPWETGMGLALAVVVGLALVSHFVQSRRTAQERDRAEEVTALMTSLFEVADPHTSRGETISAREVLDRGVERIREERLSDPSLRAPLLSTMAQVYSNLGLYEDAGGLAEEALELHRELGAGQRQETDAIALLGRTRLLQGRYEEAESLLRTALDDYRDLHGEEHAETARLVTDLALALIRQDRYRQAQEMLPANIEIQRRLFPNGHLDLVRSLGALGTALQYQEFLNQAEGPMREQLALARRLVGEAPHPTLAQVLNDVSLLDYMLGNLDAAEAGYRECLEILHQLYGERHPDIARTISNIAFVVRDRGRVEEAVNLLGQSFDMRSELLGPEHPDLGAAATRLARGLLYIGRPAEALPKAELAHRILAESLDHDHIDMVYIDGLVGASLSGVGRHADAEPRLLRSYRGIVRARGEQAHDTRVALGRLVRLYEDWDRPEEAERYRQRLEQAKGDTHPD